MSTEQRSPDDRTPTVTSEGTIHRSVSDVLASPNRHAAAETIRDVRASKTLIDRLRAEYSRTGAYAPSSTCRHGIHPYDCRQGCAPPGFEAADEIERLTAELQDMTDTYHANGWPGPNGESLDQECKRLRAAIHGIRREAQSLDGDRSILGRSILDFCERALSAEPSAHEKVAIPALKPKLDSTERFYAEMESERNVAVDEYFEARPQIMRTHALDAIYRAGFERAYRQLWPRLALEMEASPPDVEDELAWDRLVFGTAYYWLRNGRKVRVPPYELYIDYNLRGGGRRQAPFSARPEPEDLCDCKAGKHGGPHAEGCAATKAGQAPGEPT